MRRKNQSPAEHAYDQASDHGLRPPPTIPLSRWMDEYFQPDPTHGPWHCLPFQRGIADAMSDPEIETVTVLKSARVGFTKLLVGYQCYRIANDPCGLLTVLPAQEDAEGFSKDDLAPALEATPVVNVIMGDPRARDSGNTMSHKRFAGGFARIIGAHSGRGFRRITVDVVEWDEVDAYPPSAGAEGDPIELGKKRAFTAAFPKFILGSTPRLTSTSRIISSWNESDQRDFIVPCPRCDHGQRLQWGGRDLDFGIKWPRNAPLEAYYLCEHCHEPIQHHQKNAMVEQGIWQTDKVVPGHAGFRVWAGYSPFPAADWGKLAEEFLRVKDNPLRLQVFVNTVLGEPFGDEYQTLNHERLMARRESYPTITTGRSADGTDEVERVVPSPVAVMTAGVDVQDDRIEIQVAGWGTGEECWKLEYKILYGDPAGPGVWQELDEFLLKPRQMERGGLDYIRAAGLDTGGHHTQKAYEFCRPRYRRWMPDGRRAYVFALKGRAAAQTGKGVEGRIWPHEASRKNKAKVLLWTVNVDPAKELLMKRLNRIDEPGPGFIHFPAFFGETYFQQLDSEKCELKHDKRGFPYRQWELKTPGRRNEAWDTAVYDYIALCGLKAHGFDLEAEVRKVGARKAEADAPKPPPKAKRAAPPPDPPAQPDPQPTAAAAAKRTRYRRWSPAQL